jgi:hypothetical protein
MMGDTRQQMQIISACEYPEFAMHMIKQFGEKEFKVGFDLI